ncbi:MAG: nucleotidyltransferase family protein [Muribaculaceae bacterium]|nr:nucleotidyltransferase family protein [Muribaculaceae bacterium]
MTDAERQLLALVRAALWKDPVCQEPFSSADVDWQKIGRLAMQQTVGVLAIEGALALPAYLQPPKDWVRKAITFVEGNRRTHILLDRCVAEAVSRLHGAGIETVLLKGQAYARAYHEPEMRQCGDIDLYVGESGYFSAYSAASDFGWKSRAAFQPEAKHYNTELRGVSVELHRIAGKMPYREADSYFQEWSRKQLSGNLGYLEIGGERIAVPPPLFSVVFVFVHLYHHFMNGGIGLRHLCDWTMLLHAHFRDIDKMELETVLCRSGLMKAWRLFAPIPVEHLGLRRQECPFYDASCSRKAGKILALIMKEGNFGVAVPKPSVRPAGYFAAKVHVLRNLVRHQYPRLWIFPSTVMRYFGRSVYRGAARVLNDMKEGKIR